MLPLSANTKIRELRFLDLSFIAEYGMVDGGHGGARVLQPVFHLFDSLPSPLHSSHQPASEPLHSAHSALSRVHAPPHEPQTGRFLLSELAEIHSYVEHALVSYLGPFRTPQNPHSTAFAVPT